MTKKQIDDDIVGEIHRVRAELIAEHNGSMDSLVKKLQNKQAASGKKVIKRLNPTPRQQKAG